MTTANRKLGKFEITQVANGFILGLINSDYRPGMDRDQPYYKVTYIAKDAEDLASQLVAHLVVERMEKEE